MRNRYTDNTVTIVTLRHRTAMIDRVYPGDIGVPLDPVPLGYYTAGRWRYSFTAQNSVRNYVGSGWVFDRIALFLAPVEVVEETGPPQAAPPPTDHPMPWWHQAAGTVTGRVTVTPWDYAAQRAIIAQQAAPPPDVMDMARQVFEAARQQQETIRAQRAVEHNRLVADAWAELLPDPLPLNVNPTPLNPPTDLDTFFTQAPPTYIDGDGEDA